MRSVTVVQTGVGFSQPVVLDQYLTPENVGWAAVIDGTPTYNVEFTQSDPYATYPTSFNQDGIWTQLTGYTNITTSRWDNVAYPVRALRINQTAGPTSSVTFTVNQAGVR